MNPWTKAVGPQLRMPVRVDAHAAELMEGSVENVTDIEAETAKPAKGH